MPFTLIVGIALTVLGILGVFVAMRRSWSPSPSGGAERARMMLRGALIVVTVGVLLVGVAVGRKDAVAESECDLACREWGLRDAHVTRSRTEHVDGDACFCGHGASAHQLYEIGATGQPRGTSVPPPSISGR